MLIITINAVYMQRSGPSTHLFCSRCLNQTHEVVANTGAGALTGARSQNGLSADLFEEEKLRPNAFFQNFGFTAMNDIINISTACVLKTNFIEICYITVIK
jgi:hypothetical protein